jgi:hypothetical protein
MTRAVRHPTSVRVRAAHVDRLDERLSPRDWSVIQTVNLLRVATGRQLERLCFMSLSSDHSRTVTRSRVLARLTRDRVLVAFGRQVGGSGRGSTTQAYALDTAGRELIRRRQLAEDARVRVRRPGRPSERTLRHSLAVSGLYADLVTQAPMADAQVAEFRTEPGSWWPNGLGGFLKPDAYVVLERASVRDHWWVEMDLATESLPVIRSKVQAYLDFRERGVLGPDGVLPWLVIATVTSKRLTAIAGLVHHLPEAAELVTVVLTTQAAAKLLEILRE